MIEPKPYFLFTRTPLHIGAGQSVGYVDLPIQREPHTRIPIVPGSSLKGVLADLWNETVKDKRKSLDGTEEEVEVIRRSQVGEWLFGKGAGDSGGGSAGALLVGEARVLCFPVRSAKGSFAWITCPLALARYARDAKPKDERGERLPTEFHGLTETPKNGSVRVLAGSEVTLDGGQVVLEEYTYTVVSEKGSEEEKERAKELLAAHKSWETQLANLDGLKDDSVWKLMPGRLVIVPDGIFSFYVQSACEIAQHVAINDDTGTAQDKALFNEEHCPPETLFCGIIAAQSINQKPAEGENGAISKLASLNGKPLQIGGGETTGLGWCSFIFKPSQN